MSFDESATFRNWSDVSLGSEDAQELKGSLQFRRGSRSASVSENAYEEKNGIDQDAEIRKYEGKFCNILIYSYSSSSVETASTASG